MFSHHIWTLVFVASLLVLIKASDYFTTSAEKVGLSFGISPFIIGVTLLATGTSMPELVSSILAVLRGSSEIVVGNVIGSNITNVFLILGLSAIMGRRLKTTYDLVHVDMPLFVGSAFLLTLTIWDGNFSRPEALICLACFAIYLLYAASVEKEVGSIGEDISRCSKQFPLGVNVERGGRDFESVGKIECRPNERPDPKVYVILILSLFFIYIGANYTVISAIRLSQILGVSTEIIAASAVALGTSLPELVVSVSAAMKGKPELAIGNVMGSNIFNGMGIMGISALFGTLIIPKMAIDFLAPMMLVSTALYFLITWEKEITRWEGWMLVIFYLFFLGKLLSLS